ncbi:hypothetical protein BC829DRAFT_402136 [Chytridium lagenaria]|nr:hypothetical protein BC829DRAFT_402136 [Chytridium lagenaria]
MSSSPITAKIAYSGTLRTQAVNEATTWQEFEANIRRLHSISSSSQISVTYTDSDGDRIALDTDGELLDLIRQIRGSSRPTIRFEVTSARPEGDSSSFVLVGEKPSPPASVAEEPAIIVETSNSATEVSTPVQVEASIEATVPVKVTASAEATPPVHGRTIPIVDITNEDLKPYSFASTETEKPKVEEEKVDNTDKGKKPAETTDEDPGEGSSKSGNGPEFKFEKFSENLEPLLEQLKTEFEKSNLGPIFEKIATEAKTNLEPALNDIFSNIHRSFANAQNASNVPPNPFFPFAQPPFTRASPCHSQRGPRCGRFARPSFEHPTFPFAPASSEDSTWPPRWSGIVCDSCDAKSFSGARHKCSNCPDYDLCAGCYPSANVLHDASHTFVKVRHPREKLMEEALQRIRELGLVYDDASEAKAKEMLVRYGGNADRVVEILLREEAL